MMTATLFGTLIGKGCRCGQKKSKALLFENMVHGHEVEITVKANQSESIGLQKYSWTMNRANRGPAAV